MPPPDFDDPYQPPETPPGPSGPQPADLELFLFWEKLRVLYNLSLTTLVLLVWAGLLRSSVSFDTLLVESIVGAVGANVCFCAGPVANAYAYWLGWRHPVVTFILFVTGTVFSMLLVLGLLVAGAGGLGID
jgi:hypothetical protein